MYIFSLLSVEGWNSLVSLPVDENEHMAVLSETLKLNGFSLRRGESDCYTVTAAADTIPGYGSVADLDDILVNIKPAGDCYRPMKVCHHIQVSTGVEN